MKQKQKTFLSKIGIIASAISPIALVASSSAPDSNVANLTLKSVIQSLDSKPFESLVKTKDGSPINLPSSILKPTIIDKIKLVPNFAKLNNVEKRKFKDSNVKIIPKDEYGILKIEISIDDYQKNIFVHGFKLDSVDSKIEFLIANLNDEWDYYTTIFPMLPSEIARLDFTEGQWIYTWQGIFNQAIEVAIKSSKWSKEDMQASSSQILDNLDYFLTSITSYDTFGVLSLKIQYGSTKKTINIKNFETKQNKLLPSEITKNHLLIALWSMEEISSSHKKNLDTSKITITNRNFVSGELSYDVDWIPRDTSLETSFKIVNLKNKKQVDAEKLENAIKKLLKTALGRNSNGTKFPSEITRLEVLGWIKALEGINSLTNDQKLLLKQGDIFTLSNDNDGTLTITISNHGTNKVFDAISGFKTNAKVLRDAIKKLSPGAFDGKGESSKLPSEITRLDALSWIKALEDIDGLTNDQKILLREENISLAHDDNVGTLKVTINDHGDTKSFNAISSFKTNAKVLEEAIEKLPFNALDGRGESSKFPSEITRLEVLGWIKALGRINSLTSDQKLLLTQRDINLDPDDNVGILSIIINYGTSPKFISITSGFKANAKILENALKKLPLDALVGKGDSSRFPSEITKLEVYSWISDLDSIRILSDPQKLFLATSITINLAHDDNAGTLEVTISDYEDAIQFNVIIGFKTHTKVLANAIYGLESDILNSLSDATKLPDEISRKEVYDTLKELPAISTLSNEQKALFIEGNVLLQPNNSEGNLNIIINGYGEPKTFTISNFKTNAKVLADAIRRLVENALDGKGDDTKLPSEITEPIVLGWIKALEGINSLTNDQKLLLTEENISLARDNNAGTLQVTINGHGKEKTFTISNFKTNAKVLANAIEGLAKNVLDGNGDSSKLPSTIKAALVLGWIKALAAINSLDDEQKDLLVENNIRLTSSDNAGTLQVTINGYGDTKVFDVIRNFQTTADFDKAETRKAVEGLRENVFDRLSDVTKLPEEIKAKDVFDALKGLLAISDLSIGQQALLSERNIALIPDNGDGTLEVTINGHGEPKTFIISNFKTNAKVLADAIQGLAKNALDGKSDDTKLPSEITLPSVLGWIKALEDISGLDGEQKLLLTEENINLANDDNVGTLEVTISGHGKEKTFTISDFKTNAKVLANAIEGLARNVFDGNGDSSKLPTAIKKALVLDWIKDLEGINSLTDDQKLLLIEENISLDHDDNAGTLKVTINGYGETKVFDVIRNFQTTADFDKAKTRKAVEGLRGNVFDRLSDVTKLPKEIKAKDVFDALKGLSAISDLSIRQQALISERNIALVPDNGDGTLEVTINGHGEPKTFIISNFKTNLKVLADAIQGLAENAFDGKSDDTKLPSEITKLDVLGLIKTLEGINSLTKDQKLLLIESNINLVHDDNVGTLEVTISGHGVPKTFTIRNFKTNAKVLANAIKGLAENALDGKSVDTKLPTEITTLDVLNWIKDLATINSLDDDQKNLLLEGHINLVHDDNVGTLEVTINGHGEPKTFIISNFKTNAKVLANAIKGLAENALDGKNDDTKFPSEITTLDVLNWIKALEGINSLTNDQKLLLIEGNINLAHDDNAGTLEVKISGHGDVKVFNFISNFKTTLEFNIQIINKAIYDLANDAFDGLVSKDTLPSAISNQNVLDHLKGLSTIKNLSNDQKSLFFKEDISLKANDGDGKLEVTIERHGDDKIFEIKGFKKQFLASDDKPIELSLPILIGIIIGGNFGIGIGGYLVYYLIKRKIHR